MTPELAAALVAAQAEMPAVDKTGKSNFGKHVTLDHLIAKTRPVLTKHGLAIMQFPAMSELGAPTLRTVLMHESGESIQADGLLFLNGKQDMQTLGGCYTYARRYGWSSVLGISTEDDDDGDAASAPPKAKAATNGTTTRDLAAEKIALLALIEEKGGDTKAAGIAFESASITPEFDEWLRFQTEHWAAQPTPFRSPVTA